MAHYTLTAPADFGTFNRRHAPHRHEITHPDVDPCELGASYTVYDEDGLPLINFEMESKHAMGH